MGDFKNMILFIYTLVLFILHGYGFLYIFHAEYTSEFKYPEIMWFLLFITSLQYLDIPFSFFLTKSNPVAVFVQVSGRLLVLWVASHMVSWKYAAFSLVAVYLLSELCRGPYYLSNCLGTPNRSLTWLRYNAFKVLYPVGFTCEALVFINVFFVSGKIPIDIKDRYFQYSLLFTVFFLTIVTFLYRSMSRKAAQKNKTLAKME
ncbi:Very-long-chain (3R)-3-hydroxyacyl-CoA dehydratase [Caenorhabditis elegans]|uniref:Very-long-chain (3R)-3-hydroxyacyl-CoA dehydratase n=1 Tax=Caenorhabditis elegans TaxID=6239 RepID=Q21905_CAEEL|nr:Very-long-chain (3R)-3-hydroxyacyl-CoA dehydratase [Caenorhabditis elegans]CAA90769.1 Very-long-chain (3R)-3-hydroxyacyl-CoA dehydratase [Caenorhabditis elegans]|eukprot:NP_497864.1 Very-long-chain (3R)-3-hydroxyacyl-CoA dehydratase [Caenorhabditis elegans]